MAGRPDIADFYSAVQYAPQVYAVCLNVLLVPCTTTAFELTLQSAHDTQLHTETKIKAASSASWNRKISSAFSRLLKQRKSDGNGYEVYVFDSYKTGTYATDAFASAFSYTLICLLFTISIIYYLPLTLKLFISCRTF